MRRFKTNLRKLLNRGRAVQGLIRPITPTVTSTAYWTNHMVVKESFPDRSASLEYFHWRNAQYPGYLDLMPVTDADGLVVLDYGCGPGNDLVGFGEYSKPRQLIGLDVSPTALDAARSRLTLHGIAATLLQVDEVMNRIPLPDASVDLVHSSGVLHHAANLPSALGEIRRILRPGGRLRTMVYNYDSLWLHLYTAYTHQIELGLYSNLSVREAFRHTTDGPDCPISRCFTPSEFTALVCEAGFRGNFKGAAISLAEMAMLPKRIMAMQDRRLPREHREFLGSLRFDERCRPLHQGAVAGIDAVFEFSRI